VNTNLDKLEKKQIFLFFREKYFFDLLPKTGFCCCFSMEWSKMDDCCCCFKFIVGMLVDFSSWWNIVLNSLSNTILDQSAAPGTDVWVWADWRWWLTEVFGTSNRKYDDYD